MKKYLILAFASVLFFNSPAPAAMTAEQILLKADEVRNPQLDYVIWVEVASFKPKTAPKKSTIEVWVKGKDKTLTRIHSPATDRGQVMLNRDRGLWVFLPTVSQPLRISLQERLLGEVANGDIARMNFAADYNPVLEKREKIGGKNCYLLKLTAKSEEVTYGSVRLWVEEKTFHPIKADLYAFTGRLLKTCSYEDYGPLGGENRPRKLVFQDAVKKDHYSTIGYSDVKAGALAEKYFNKNYMKKFADF